MSDIKIMKEWLQHEYSLGLPRDVKNILKSNLPSKYEKKNLDY